MPPETAENPRQQSHVQHCQQCLLLWVRLEPFSGGSDDTAKARAKLVIAQHQKGR